MAWAEYKKWNENWEELEKLDGGGQGQGYKVRKKGTGDIAFLKRIKNKEDQERRARFSREANAYYDLSVPNVPKLIESNAHLYKDDSTIPYIVIEYIEGHTLRKWRESLESVNFEDAVIMTNSLLNTIRQCHEQGHFHRDIKPDNILVQKANSNNLVLIDFGLGINNLESTSFSTEDGQEIGNRFLRLPELAPGSSLKQDFRSDLSFAGGVFFYLLTGKHPDQLQDAEGRLPHQRGNTPLLLRDIAKDKYFKLTTFFDSAFSPILENRFSSIEAMINSLVKILKDEDIHMNSDLEAILAVTSSESEKFKKSMVKKIEEALDKVVKVYGTVQVKINKSVYPLQVNQKIGFNSGLKRHIWKKDTSGESIMETTCEAMIYGDELVIKIENEPIYRTAIEQPVYDQEFTQAIENWLYGRINIALNYPDLLPPNPKIFREIKPVLNIDEAIDKSRLVQRYILAFVYDPSQEEKGKIDHQLGYFLQNKKTRDLLSSNFVIALLTIKQVAEKSDVLQDKSMESSRWVIFDAEFKAHKEAVIYANSSEGEKIAQQLTEEFLTK